MFAMIQGIRSPSPKKRFEREIWSFAPYSISIYQNLLKQLSSSGEYIVCHLENVLEIKRKNKISILIRHDIDTLDCIRNMTVLLEEDLRYGFIPCVYLRVDREAYSIREWRTLLDAYQKKGVPFGLHSTCYIHDNYLERFRQETKIFIEETGIIPKSFTLHGLGQYCLKNRIAFISKARRIGKENSYVMTDCSKDYVSYDYVLHDSHWDEASQRRYILKDFEEIPLFSRGKSYLVLTHPCYWENKTNDINGKKHSIEG